jgi:hypothetical protein
MGAGFKITVAYPGTIETPSTNVGYLNKWWYALPLLLLALGLTGCGNGLSRVSGRITLDGKPLTSGQNVVVTVLFYPESGRGAPGAGLADSNGNYFVSTGSQKGLPPGNYVVTLSASEYTPPPGGGMPSRKLLTPPRYANPKLSGLRTEVKPGSNTYDIQLSSSDVGRS